jgi:TRAP-type C4-dicarboxylate transport system permease large subunit
MAAGGISGRLVDLAKAVVGGVQGGLACSCVLTCMLFASVSGSSVATTFAIGAILIPAMVKHGYPRPLAASVQASSAALGIIIPPSIAMNVFGISAHVDIGKLSVARMAPPANRPGADSGDPPVVARAASALRTGGTGRPRSRRRSARCRGW